jgi:hypothetical protein
VWWSTKKQAKQHLPVIDYAELQKMFDDDPILMGKWFIENGSEHGTIGGLLQLQIRLLELLINKIEQAK